MVYDKLLMDNIKKVIKYSDGKEMTIEASKSDITLVDLSTDLVVRNTYDGINVWGHGNINTNNYETSQYQMFILRTSFDRDNTEQDLLYPLLSALRLAQQSFDTIVNGNFKELSPQTVVVLLIDAKEEYGNRSRIKEFASYYINRCENFYIAACYKYNSQENIYELFENDDATFGKIFPLLPVSNEKYKFAFQPLDYRELTSIRNVDKEQSYLDIAVDRLSYNLKERVNEVKNKLFNSVYGETQRTKREKLVQQDLNAKKYLDDYDKTISPKLKTLTYLAQIIWLTMLKGVAETADDDDDSLLHILDISSESIDKFEINKELIKSTYLSAIEYADGISQILENSVVHSSGHIGFFSLRTYYVDCVAPPSKAVDCARYRQAITQKYCVAGNEPFENSRYMIEFTVIDYAIPVPSNSDKIIVEDRKQYYQDNVSGIIDVFHDNNEGVKLSSDTLEGVFNFRSSDMDQIAHHLGLKLFRSLIEENGGIFSVISPRRDGNKDYACYFHLYKRTGRSKDTSSENKVRGFTKYSVVLPIMEQVPDLRHFEHENKSFVVSESAFADKKIEQFNVPNPDHKALNLDEHTSKIEVINKIRDYYKNQILTNNSENIVIPVISYELSNTFMEDCERLAKISLLLQYDLCKEYKQISSRRFLALNFVSDKAELADQAIGFFIRIYASFYKKAGEGRIPALGSSQLALFVTDKKASTQYVLNICGETSDDLRATAEHFVYSGFPLALKQASQLRFLFDKSNNSSRSKLKGLTKHGNAIKLFPYDLFVCDELSQQDSVFVSSVKRELDKELGAEISKRQIEGQIRNGVCLKSTHVALSSGIHIDRFYQAELLFHNNFIIKNFAILMARDLICKLNQKEYIEAKHNGIVVVGYENYSHVLIEQVAYYLNEYANSLGIGHLLDNKEYPHVAYCTFAGQIDIVNGIKTRVVPKFRLQHLVRNINKNLINVHISDLFIKDDNGKEKSPLFVIVEPIATTSNTILQIRRALKHFPDNGVLSINYSLIISAPKNDASSGDHNKDGLKIRAQYWESNEIVVPKIDKFGGIQLKRDYPNEAKQVVQYLIHVGSNWYCAHSCPMCNKDVALDWVDKTSTTTYLIHELLGSNKRGITFAVQTASSLQKEINNDRIGFLRGNIAYGHTQTQSNHFLFNLDLKHTLEGREKLTIGGGEKVTCRDDVEKWLSKIGIEVAAFNVFIAPLHERNSPFVRMVSEFALKQNIRFIHFDVSATPRETVRTDFIYVADEISNIIKDNPCNKVNIYYCDDSNVSGESVHRAMLIMKMLLNEARLTERDYNRVSLFKGIVLFVNRSSYESLQQFVRNPDTDVYSYINLGVPNYNTHQGVCYDCSFMKKLELEKKRTVSSRDICDIDRLIKKHRLLTVSQFWEVIKSELFTSGKYLKWLKSWRLINPEEKLPKEIENVLKGLNKKTSEFLTKAPKLTSSTGLNDIITKISDIRLDDLISEEEKNKNRESIWQFFKNKVIADRYYMRLLCTHKLYCALEPVSKSAESNDDLYRNTLLAVLDLLIEEKQKIKADKKFSNTPIGKQQGLVNYCELLISYIKILSREQLVRFYHIRQVAIDIMLFLLLSCIKGVNEAVTNACRSGRMVENDQVIFDKYRKILDGLIFSNLDKPNERSLKLSARQENSLNAGSQAFLVISLIKKISHLDSVFFMKKDPDDISLKISEFPDIWRRAVNKYLGINDYADYYNSADKKQLIAFTTMPSFDYFVNVYQNALRWTLLTTHDDNGKSYRVEDVYNSEEEDDE